MGKHGWGGANRTRPPQRAKINQVFNSKRDPRAGCPNSTARLSEGVGPNSPNPWPWHGDGNPCTGPLGPCTIGCQKRASRRCLKLHTFQSLCTQRSWSDACPSWHVLGTCNGHRFGVFSLVHVRQGAIDVEVVSCRGAEWCMQLSRNHSREGWNVRHA